MQQNLPIIPQTFKERDYLYFATVPILQIQGALWQYFCIASYVFNAQGNHNTSTEIKEFRCYCSPGPPSNHS